MEKKRLLYIDNIRMLVIVLVVVFHIAMTYSGSGRWYYADIRPVGFVEGMFFGFFQSFSQAFFMGLLFLVAGYFVPGAYDKKGFGKFLKDRAVRLGIPSLIYIFAVDPFTECVILGRHKPGQGFLSYWADNITNGHFLSGNGPLWFAIALLFFSIIYALFRLAAGNRGKVSRMKINAGAKSLGVLVLIIAAIAFVIRIFFPIVTAFFNMMVCFFAQYIVLFTAGILAYRHDLFSKLSYNTGVRLLCWAPIWGFGGWGAMMLACQIFFGGDYALYNGGLTWQSALYSLWESFTAIAMDAGLIVLFRERYNNQSRLTKELSCGAFAVYAFHTPVIVAITLLFAPAQWPPFFKFAAMSAICVPACFAAASVVRRIPLLKKVM